MNEIPLYGAMQCEVLIHRRLIETWVYTLDKVDGSGHYWMDLLFMEYGQHQRNYSTLGRVLFLSWYIQHETQNEILPDK